MANSSNIIGDVGENTAALRLSKTGIFKVYFLGEKAPITDFMLEILDDRKPYHALVQVKSTDQTDKYDAAGNMRTPVPDDKLLKLIARPLPTYVAGADIDDEVVFIAPAFDVNVRYPHIPPKLKLDLSDKVRSKRELERLKEDIINYWDSHRIPQHKSTYQSTL